jgi:peroxiredoxin
VLGISPDQPAKLAKFAERDGLTFPLLSDPERKVLQAYGAYGEKMLYGKTTVGVIRSTFVVGGTAGWRRPSTASRPPATSPAARRAGRLTRSPGP